MTGNSLLGAAAPGFDSPLEMLDACHGRIHAQCDTLRRLANHLPGHGADEAARQAASSVIRYFSSAAEHHHADEERDLFPALLAHAGEREEEVRRLIGRLLADHAMMARARQAMMAKLEAIREGTGSALSLEEVDAFSALYGGHIDTETREMLPLAAELLSAEELACIGRVMAERRGARFPDTGLERAS